MPSTLFRALPVPISQTQAQSYLVIGAWWMGKLSGERGIESWLSLEVLHPDGGAGFSAELKRFEFPVDSRLLRGAGSTSPSPRPHNSVPL